MSKFYKWKSQNKLQSSVHKRLFCKIYAKKMRRKIARVFVCEGFGWERTCHNIAPATPRLYIYIYIISIYLLLVQNRKTTATGNKQ